MQDQLQAMIGAFLEKYYIGGHIAGDDRVVCCTILL